MKYNKVFESERINYVRLNEDLVDDYLTMVNDIDIQKLISTKVRVYTKEDEIDWINTKLKNNECIFSMLEKETDKFIGNIEIMQDEPNIGELGIVITPSMQDKHYGQEAVKRIIDYAFENLNITDLVLDVFDFNERGIHCYEKVGFVQEGTGRTEKDIHMIYKR